MKTQRQITKTQQQITKQDKSQNTHFVTRPTSLNGHDTTACLYVALPHP